MKSPFRTGKTLECRNDSAHNARHQNDPKLLSEWKTESHDNYATLGRPLPESKTDRVYMHDRDCLCNPWDEPDIYDINALSFKLVVKNPPKQVDAIMK